MQRHLDEFLSEKYKSLGRLEKRLLFKEIGEKFESHVHSGNDFSDEEGKCLLSDGLLGVLRMRCPELEQNEVFSFLVKLNNTIQNLETKFVGHPYSDIKTEIQTHLQDINSDDYNIWKAIQLNYTQNLNWIGDIETGKGGNRATFIKAIEQTLDKRSLLQQKEEELSSLEAEAKVYDEELKSRQQDGQSLGEE